MGPECRLPSSSTGEQYSSFRLSNGLKMFLKESASVKPRTDSGRADRNAKFTPGCMILQCKASAGTEQAPLGTGYLTRYTSHVI